MSREINSRVREWAIYLHSHWGQIAHEQFGRGALGSDAVDKLSNAHFDRAQIVQDPKISTQQSSGDLCAAV